MKYDAYRACSRAWVSTCERAELRITQVLERICSELIHAQHMKVVGLALFVRDVDGIVRLGIAGKTELFSEPTLLGMFHDLLQSERDIRIVDHVLDGGWYLGDSIRTSMLAKASRPCGVVPSGDVGAWIGVGRNGKPTDELLTNIRDVSSAVAEWLSDNSPLIEKWRALCASVRDLKGVERDIRVIAHDVRAPLSALMRRSQEGEVPSLFTGDFGDVLYVRELLELLSARIRRDVNPESRERHLLEVIERVRSRFALQARDKGLELRLRSDTLNEIVLWVPSLVLERVLSNLIENSVRYTETGSVEISVQVVDGKALIEIRDTGDGFPQDVLRELSDPKGELLSNSHGWGVGLLSSKSAIEREGGRIVFGSSENNGALIRLELPVKREALSVGGALKSSLMPKTLDTSFSRAVLLVDDDEEHTRSLGRVLEGYGIGSIRAHSVAEALELLASTRVLAVFCDAHMPDGGAETLLLAVGQEKRDWKVAVMSGDSDDGVLYQLASKGAEAFFPKPVELEAIMHWLAECTKEPLSPAFGVAGLTPNQG